MKEAYLYSKLDNERVRCSLCNHRCIIRPGERGVCGVRENIEGILYSLVYDKLITRNIDPIEKKPLFHFLPGSSSYSIATVGCNLTCLFCQNSDISQMPRDLNRIWGENISPEKIIDDVIATGATVIAYTYTEPTIYYELAIDIARKATPKGLKNVFVSNGYMTEECIRDMHPDLHGANIDLKSFNDTFYKEQCGARLKPVLNNIETMCSLDIWVEVTTLLIPGLNDSDEELRSLARFLAGVNKNIPWHISRFHPTYKLQNIKPTPPETIHRAREIGYGEGLRYVYTGNLPGDQGEKTYCHGCGKLLIDRIGFSVRNNRIKDNKCPDCLEEIPGVWN